MTSDERFDALTGKVKFYFTSRVIRLIGSEGNGLISPVSAFGIQAID
jgi:hypothetical protein